MKPGMSRPVVVLLLLSFLVPYTALPAAAESIDRQIEREYGFYTDAGANARVQRIYARLEATLPKDKPHPKSVKIIRSGDLNAFATTDAVYLTSRIVNDSTDEELAAVMAHEVAHVTERHVQKAQSRAIWLLLLGVAAGVAIKNKDGGSIINDEGSRNTLILANMFANNKFTEGDERQADAMGIEMMAKAGYNPEGMASLFKKLGNGIGDVPVIGFVLRDHPATSKRMKIATERAKGLMPVYLAAKAQYEGPAVAAAPPATPPTTIAELPATSPVPGGKALSPGSGGEDVVPDVAHIWHQGYLMDGRTVDLPRGSQPPVIEVWGSNLAGAAVKLLNAKSELLWSSSLEGDEPSFTLDTSQAPGAYAYEIVVTFRSGQTRSIGLQVNLQ